MNLLWNVDRPLTATEIVNMTPERTWKKSYIHLLINSLIQKELIKSDSLVRTGRNFGRTFIATMTEEELYLERKQAHDNVETTKQYYQGVIDFNKNLTDGFFAAYERDVKNSFDLYKLSRDQKDELTKRIDEVDKKVDVMAAIRPYQDALINSKIDNVAMVADFNLARRTCRMISGEVVLPSTPTVTGYASYSQCQCGVQQAPTT